MGTLLMDDAAVKLAASRLVIFRRLSAGLSEDEGKRVVDTFDAYIKHWSDTLVAAGGDLDSV